MEWFSRAAVSVDAANDLTELELFAWNCKFYWGVDYVVLPSRVWQRFITVYDMYFSYHATADAKRAHQVNNVAKGMFPLAGGPLVEDGVDVDLSRYPYFGERPYVANLCY